MLQLAADKVSSPIQHGIKQMCFVSHSTTVRMVLHLFTTGKWLQNPNSKNENILLVQVMAIMLLEVAR